MKLLISVQCAHTGDGYAFNQQTYVKLEIMLEFAEKNGSAKEQLLIWITDGCQKVDQLLHAWSRILIVQLICLQTIIKLWGLPKKTFG